MKVTFEMEDVQVDAIVVQVLKNNIEYAYTDSFWTTEDQEYNEKLKEALWVVFEYLAGEAKAEELKNSIEGEKDEV